MVSHEDFYSEYKWCTSCKREVHYLKSIDRSFCTNCGNVVRVFRNLKELRTLQRPPMTSPRRQSVSA